MNPNRIDLNLLKVFDAILQTSSVTIAASNLGLTQSAVSNALSRLRDALGDPLFVRTSEGMVPTPRASEIAVPIRQGLATIRQTLENYAGFDPATAERTFRLFMTDVGQMVLLPSLIDQIRAAAPGVDIQTAQVPPFRLREAAMESGDVDIAVGYFLDFEGPFHCQRLFSQSFVCVVRSDHPRIQGGMDIDEFLRADHLVYLPSGGGHGYQENLVERFFLEHGIQRRVAIRVAHFLGIWKILEHSDLVLTIPCRLAHVCAGMIGAQVLDPPVELPSFDVTQYWHERFHHDPANRWLRQQIATLYGV